MNKIYAPGGSILLKKEESVNIFKYFIIFLAVVTVVLTGIYCLAETEQETCDPNAFFKACDKNKDGKISREEWNQIDTNKDSTITQDEWDKYQYKTEDKPIGQFKFKFVDIYNPDGFMDRQEFLRNLQKTE
jgi:Ca2+-binding EF-hand superfamily protein